MEDYMWLESPIHINNFKVDFSEDVRSMLMLSFDGTIVALKKELIESDYNSEESKMIRLGMLSAPKKISIKSEEDFIKYMSYQNFSD
tara:strand:- start:217 stop:477 length:261 start_codon:yes stop_codon:yes gene_type:complete